MWYQVLIPGPVLMIPILIMTTKGTHSPKNDSNQPSDVIVTYMNHAEAHNEETLPLSLTGTEKSSQDSFHGDFEYEEKSTTLIPSTMVLDTEYGKENLKEVIIPNKLKKEKKWKPDTKVEEEPVQEDVVFIPNERESEVIRNEYYLQKDRASLQDLMGGHKTVEDLLAAKEVRLETESPVSDIIFVVGKNNENQEVSTKKSSKKSEDHYQDTTSKPKLDCNNLNCNNTIDSVCGEKIENYTPKLRLFLNDCYFRKVNCNFKSAANRYKQVSLDRCKHIGAHYNSTPFAILKPPLRHEPKPVYVNNTRRNFSSRRSMTVNIHGQFCSHPCPASCPEHYEPECAVSSTGRHRVFVNHCALDHNSCSFGIVWHSVPLAECVGGKKADLRQNAGFIGWMQRVGIVDNRGRLVYEVDRR